MSAYTHNMQLNTRKYQPLGEKSLKQIRIWDE